MSLTKKYFFCMFLMLTCFGFHSKSQIKYKLFVFEGSDWCSNCHRLEQNILSDSIFIEQLKKSSILIEKIDFPQRKKLNKETRKYNNSMAEKYHFDGSFPTLILSRTDTLIFQKIIYLNQSAEVILGQIKSKTEDLK